MLVLSRKVGERIQIGDDIELIVTSIQGNRVQLGIAAPKSVRITRAELDYKKVTLEQAKQTFQCKAPTSMDSANASACCS